MQTLSDSIYQFLISINVGLSPSRLSLDGRHFDKGKLLSGDRGVFALPSVLEKFSKERDTLNPIQVKEISKEVLTALESWKEESKGKDDETEGIIKEILNNFDLVVDVKTNEYFYLEPDTKFIVKDVTPAHAFELLGPKSRLLKLKARKVNREYQPYRYETEWDSERVINGEPLKIINTHRPPKWKEFHPEAKQEWLEKPPELFTQILNSLVKEQHRNKVLDWMATAMTSKVSTFLHLRGKRGNGKSNLINCIYPTFGDVLIPNTTERSPHNGEYINKKLIFFDDSSYIGSKKGHTERKTLGSLLKTFNIKFGAVKESEHFPANIVICSNNEDDYFVTAEERREIRPDLSDKGIQGEKGKKILTHEDFIFVSHTLLGSEWGERKIEFCAHLGHYLLNRAKGVKQEEASIPLLNKNFWDNTIESLPDSQRFKKFLFREIVENHKVGIDMETKALIKQAKDEGEVEKNYSTTIKYIERCLKDFKYMDVELQYEVSKTDKTVTIQPFTLG